MKTIHLIRHGESIDNIGLRVESNKSMPLTEKGLVQVKELADSLTLEPELIVLSPYVRAQQTAKPYLEKHPNIPTEVWNVQEFTYLDPKDYNNSTRAERRQAALTYWDASIDWNVFGETESFVEFIDRVKEFIQTVRNRKESTIVVFTHGMFIYTVYQFIKITQETGRDYLDRDEMTKLKQEYSALVKDKDHFPIENVTVHTFTI